jgi:hypothetical protein
MEIQRIVAENPPLVNIYWRLNGIVADGRLSGVKLPADVYYDLRYMYMVLDEG